MAIPKKAVKRPIKLPEEVEILNVCMAEDKGQAMILLGEYKNLPAPNMFGAILGQAAIMYANYIMLHNKQYANNLDDLYEHMLDNIVDKIVSQLSSNNQDE